MDGFWAAPPVTRTVAAAVFVESLAVALGLINPSRIIYHSYFILKFPPEIWRFFTSFFVTGGIGIIFVPYILWQYGLPLERDSPRFNSASFLVYLLFVGSVIIGLAGQYIGSPVFTSALILAITYTYAQENRGRQVQFFILPIEVKYLPWAMLLLSLVQSGPEAAMVEATGIPAAHLYDFLTVYWPRYGGGRSLIPTPAFLERWFENISGAKRVEVKGHGTSFQPTSRAGPSTAQASGASTAWSSRGQGRRLGGD